MPIVSFPDNSLILNPIIVSTNLAYMQSLREEDLSS